MHAPLIRPVDVGRAGRERLHLGDRRRGWLGARARILRNVLAAPREHLTRRALARALVPALPPGPRVDPRTGYARFTTGELPGAVEIAARARAVRAALAADLPEIRAAKTGKFRLTFDLLSDGELARDASWLGFALQQEVFGPAVEYLGTLPFLARVGLGLSVHLPELPRPAYNQRLHTDRDDLVQVKLFVNAHDVEEEDGPLCFLPADVTTRVLRALARGGPPTALGAAFSDEAVFRHADPSELVRATGPAGSGVLFDGSRCLHFGSRVRAGRERLVLALVFLRAIRPHETPTNQLVREDLAVDRARLLLLRSPRRRPLGYYFPDPRERPSPAARGAAPVDLYHAVR